MGVPTLLWIVFAANTAIYIYSGRFVISRPWHLRPRLFWNPTTLWIAGVAPPSVFVALVVAAFAFTSSGWSLLVASVIAYVVFAVRPARDLLPWWMAAADAGDEVQGEHIADNVATAGGGTNPVFISSMPDPGKMGLMGPRSSESVIRRCRTTRIQRPLGRKPASTRCSSIRN